MPSSPRQVTEADLSWLKARQRRRQRHTACGRAICGDPHCWPCARTAVPAARQDAAFQQLMKNLAVPKKAPPACGCPKAGMRELGCGTHATDPAGGSACEGCASTCACARCGRGPKALRVRARAARAEQERAARREADARARRKEPKRDWKDEAGLLMGPSDYSVPGASSLTCPPGWAETGETLTFLDTSGAVLGYLGQPCGILGPSPTHGYAHLYWADGREVFAATQGDMHSPEALAASPFAGLPDNSSLVLSSTTRVLDNYAWIYQVEHSGSGGTFVAEASDSSTWPEVTDVPTKILATGWVYQTLLQPNTSVTSDFLVTYQHPAVIEVPAKYGGGWLMLLARRRKEIPQNTDLSEYAFDADDQDSYAAFARGFQEFPFGPHQELGDIIAYYCEDPSFTGSTLQGPVLLVHHLDALPNQDFFAWLGVPDGAFVEDADGAIKLFVYYSLAAPDPGVPDPIRGYDLNVSPTLVGSASLTTDKALAQSFANLLQHAAVTAYSDPQIADTGKAIALKVIDPQTLLNAFVRPVDPSLIDEYPVAGELRGTARIWAATPSMGAIYRGELLTVAVDAWMPYWGNPPSPMILQSTSSPMDPAPHTDRFGNLHLFFNLGEGEFPYPPDSPSNSRTGLGIWHSQALSSGWIRSGTHTLTSVTFGRDFIVEPPDTRGNSADRVVGSTLPGMDNDFYADPSVTQNASGCWVVVTPGQLTSLTDPLTPSLAITFEGR